MRKPIELCTMAATRQSTATAQQPPAPGARASRGTRNGGFDDTARWRSKLNDAMHACEASGHKAPSLVVKTLSKRRVS
jgi:hypothetical protein